VLRERERGSAVQLKKIMTGSQLDSTAGLDVAPNRASLAAGGRLLLLTAPSRGGNRNRANPCPSHFEM
jgi:hypothetical protein